MRSLLFVLLASCSFVFADVCSEAPWSLRLAKGTGLWNALPAGAAVGMPTRKVEDTTTAYLFLKCQGTWMQLLAPDGRSVWTKLPKPPQADVRAKLDTASAVAATKSKSKGKPLSKKRRYKHVEDTINTASDGLLGGDEDGGTVDAILAGGGGSVKKGGRGAAGEDDRMIASGGAGFGTGGSADRMAGTRAKERSTTSGAASAKSETKAKAGSSMDLGAGKIDGSLDNPSAIYILSEGSSSADAAPVRTSPVSSPAPHPKVPHASGLQAGASDDNRQYPAFLDFLACTGSRRREDTRVGERVRVRVVDAQGRGLCNAHLKLWQGQKLREELVTLSDGSTLIFPRWLDSIGTLPRLSLEISHPLGTAVRETSPDGPRTLEVTLAGSRQVASSFPVDLLFVLDVTGSMQGQIDQLKNAISILQMNLTALPNRPRLRFGLVQYRDHGDDFIARTIPFTEDAEAFSQALSRVFADGGGDTPEDLQAALDTALHGMAWNAEGLRLGFVVTDAPPHLDYGETFTYADAAHLARRRGIRLHTVGCGSLPLEGETVLRQIAEASGGKYVFLTAKGENGENDGGRPGAVSHHTGSNWNSERLETALLRLAREDIAAQFEVPPVDSAGWFEARGDDALPRDSVLNSLFLQAFQELREFSPLPLPDTLRLGVLPVSPADSSLSPQAAWLGQILSISLSRAGRVRVVERGNLGDVLREQALQGSGAVDPATVSGTGKLLGADVLLVSALHARGGDRELVLKLLKVSTGELLSATRARIAQSLLP